MAKLQLRNEKEVASYLLGNLYSTKATNVSTYAAPLAYALDYVMKKITERNEELIIQKIYQKYDPHVYERTEEFKEAWDYAMRSNGDKAVGAFEYAPETMHYNPAKGQHGTPDNDLTGMGRDAYFQYIADAYGDARDALAEILYEGNPSHLFPRGAWSNKRDVWTPLLSTVGVKIYMWFRDGCTAAGLVIK